MTGQAPPAQAPVRDIVGAARAVWQEQGPHGFTRGWDSRALQFAPAAMLFFTAFETIRTALIELGAV